MIIRASKNTQRPSVSNAGKPRKHEYGGSKHARIRVNQIGKQRILLSPSKCGGTDEVSSTDYNCGAVRKQMTIRAHDALGQISQWLKKYNWAELWRFQMPLFGQCGSESRVGSNISSQNEIALYSTQT